MKYSISLGVAIVTLFCASYNMYKMHQIVELYKPSLSLDETVYIIDDDMEIPPGLGHINSPDSCYAYYNIGDERLHLTRSVKNIIKK